MVTLTEISGREDGNLTQVCECLPKSLPFQRSSHSYGRPIEVLEAPECKSQYRAFRGIFHSLKGAAT